MHMVKIFTIVLDLVRPVLPYNSRLISKSVYTTDASYPYRDILTDKGLNMCNKQSENQKLIKLMSHDELRYGLTIHIKYYFQQENLIIYSKVKYILR